jgi:hypothetical protein
LDNWTTLEYYKDKVIYKDQVPPQRRKCHFKDPIEEKGGFIEE